MKILMKVYKMIMYLMMMHDLTWDDVARAIGVVETRFETSAKTKYLSMVPILGEIVSSSKTMFTFSLIDEDKEIIDLIDEKNGEDYKCDDSRNDDNSVYGFGG